ncbi:hypothetical protein DNK06_21125 [Pseudomonas daroniae]|uniref:Uncharacterized protein n=1 Tax=Phytopseudomonas daroniae TaxID=2487519 RepID=A0A4Q9QGR3_9GAMM|nr:MULTISPECIES: hypothetical protein [Pseudomonas]TBU73090.1 hypothetical protein DNK06_21125 [Pseudomonas daroniae]TBU75343.1 hypothetical protein DNK10_11905 [Pseudomonas daroniae]TBU77797.1 hypothetical protein DNK31_20950 [Pseudomonas sp. FRB 228]TBU87862.1 hypothetical protein DNJ99_20975 [Pseudomonas daroniae]
MSITTYEGASAVFTFADKPAILVFISLLVAAVSLYALIATIIHEKHSYALPDEELDKLK